MLQLLLFIIVILLIIIVFLLRPTFRRLCTRLYTRWKQRRSHRWKPKSPLDCPQCCNHVQLSVIRHKNVTPYALGKSPRGRKKSISTQGFACPNPLCDFCGITDAAIHALVGYGKPSNIQRLKCQACAKVFTSRISTPLYYLKSDPQQVEMVLWFLVEGVDLSVMVRFSGRSDATLRRWLERMGTHSHAWHNHLFRNLTFSLLQLDELVARIRGLLSFRYLWLAIDPVSKAIPALHLGGRTKSDAFAFLHDLKLRLLPSCTPAFTTDSLPSYFHAITAHFGSWHRPPRARKDHWQVNPDLLHGILIKRKQRNSKTFTHTRMAFGSRRTLFDLLRSVGLRPLIQTAFIERVNLTFRQSVAPLTRKTWSYAQSEPSLLLHCEWFRLYYHLVPPHQSLRLPIPGFRGRYRDRTPAMALGLTDHVWDVKDLLHYPVPQVA